MPNNFIKEMREQIQQVITLRKVLKDLEEQRTIAEDRLEQMMKQYAPDNTTFNFEGYRLTRASTTTSSLNEDGERLLATFPYDTAYWKKTPNMSAIREDDNFKRYIITKVGKSKLTLKETNDSD